MADSPEESDPEVEILSGWTLISSQGEIVPGDGDSETSESSVEVVTLDENADLVSYSSKRGLEGRKDQGNEDVRVDDSPSEICSADQSYSSVQYSTTKEVSQSLDTTSTHDVPSDTMELQNSLQYPDVLLSGSVMERMFQPIVKEEEICAVTILDDNSMSSENSKGCDESVEQSIQYEAASACSDSGVVENIQDLPAPLSDSEVVQTVDENEEKIFMPSSMAPETLNEACIDGMSKEQFPNECDTLEEQQDKDMENEDVTSDEKVNLEESEELPQASASFNSRNDSDADSDFVCLDQENQDLENVLLEEELAQVDDRLVVPLNMSGSSIGPDFNFIRGDDMARGEFFEGDDEDKDDDTESIQDFDDRIESDQSEVGSLPHNNDVGDLSSICDICDIPLVVGNTARNYRHQPNSYVNTVLNMIVVLAAMLTIGISVGIITATDLEIEEWQQAFKMEARKVKTLESQAKTLEVLLNQYKKDAQDSHEKSLKEDRHYGSLLQMIHEFDPGFADCLRSNHEDPMSCYSHVSAILNMRRQDDILMEENYPEPVKEVVNDTNSDQQASLTSDVTHRDSYEQYADQKQIDGDKVLLIQPEEKQGIQESNPVQSSESVKKSQPGANRKKSDFDIKSLMVDLDVKQLQHSLSREQERALHWQHLYLAERRYRERERDNEEIEDERDKERWEEERAHADRMECLQKLMSTNLTTLTQHVLRWNVSVFDDFANLSMLMSTVAELKQSVFSSVRKVWEEAGELFEKVQSDPESNNKGGSDKKQWGSSMNKEVIIDYFNKLVVDIKKEVDEALKEDGPKEKDEQNLKRESPSTTGKKQFKNVKKGGKNSKQNGKKQGRVVALFKKTRKSVRSLGKKVVKFFGNIKDAWKSKRKWISKVGSYFTKPLDQSRSKADRMCTMTNEEWIRTDTMGIHQVHIYSKCTKYVRSDWQKDVLENPCKVLGEYSRECNIEKGVLRKEIKQVSKKLERLLDIKEVNPYKQDKHHKVRQALMLKREFGYFLERWGNSNLILRADVLWAKCQKQFWSEAHAVYLKNAAADFKENSCHFVSLFDSSTVSSVEATMDDTFLISMLKRGRDEVTLPHSVHESEKSDEVHTTKTWPSNDDENMMYNIGDDTLLSDDNTTNHYLSGSFLTNIPSAPNVHVSESDKDRNLKSVKDEQNLSGEWVFKKAKKREHQRNEEHKSDWMFDRADYRRTLSKNEEMYKPTRKSEKSNWFLNKGDERQKLRAFDHQSDWLFKRAEAREKFHKQEYEEDRCKKKKCKQNGKRFRKHSKYDHDDQSFKKKKNKFHGNFKHFGFDS